MTKVQQSPAEMRPVVLVERYRGSGGDEDVMRVWSWDRQPLTVESGWRLLEQSRRQMPERYGSGAPYRLVLLDADAPSLNEPIPFNPGSGPMPGYVVGHCGHRVAESEWRAGFRTCERCPGVSR